MIRRGLLLISLLGIGEAAFAASFVVPPDGDFARRAPAIVIATALSSRTDLANDHILTITTMSVEEVIKGDVDGETIDVYEPGGRYGDRVTMIPGAPRFSDGERALLFLSRSGGHWMVVDLALGKFHFDTDILGREVLLRDFSDSRVWDLDGKVHREQRRGAEGFLQFLRGSVRGGPAKADYLIDAVPLVSEVGTPRGRLRPLATFTATSYSSDCDPATTHQGCRWGSFPKTVYASSINSIAADITAVTTAINAWDGATGAGINYVYGGTDGTHTGGLCGAPDSTNTVLWERDLSVCASANPFSCSMGGVLGIGGITSTSGTNTVGSPPETFFSTIEGDVEMNKGVNACIGMSPGISVGDFNSAVTHEIGHTLGFRHSDKTRNNGAACSTDPSLECSSSAIMTAVVTSGLNATLQTWDIHAASTMYPGIAAMTAVEAHATSSTNVRVQWTGTCVTTCHIYRSRFNDRTTFDLAGSSATSPFMDSGAAAGKSYLYKVRNYNGSIESPDSNTDLATTVIFTTDPLVAGSTIIDHTHLAELRTAVDAVRVLAGLAAGVYTDAAVAGVTVKAQHILELRSQLDAAMTILGLTTGGYTNVVSAGVIIHAIDYQELRNRVK